MASDCDSVCARDGGNSVLNDKKEKRGSLEVTSHSEPSMFQSSVLMSHLASEKWLMPLHGLLGCIVPVEAPITGLRTALRQKSVLSS